MGFSNLFWLYLRSALYSVITLIGINFLWKFFSGTQFYKSSFPRWTKNFTIGLSGVALLLIGSFLWQRNTILYLSSLVFLLVFFVTYNLLDRMINRTSFLERWIGRIARNVQLALIEFLHKTIIIISRINMKLFLNPQLLLLEELMRFDLNRKYEEFALGKIKEFSAPNLLHVAKNIGFSAPKISVINFQITGIKAENFDEFYNSPELKKTWAVSGFDDEWDRRLIDLTLESENTIDIASYKFERFIKHDSPIDAYSELD